ncbi:uncharacterized protein EV422DRAFT_577485 [Fimicolochytrium jonesii]|uniref:uncharacterized protein n=1 Tax=Fimicolochytrium jonesii TaxID=1396493 RepID=UPI0022FEBD37|nr:uncharacterized protein EV422DRAFT_577485 [Fimicolochytrium jonesii]KAI8822376.1 hypothetical protein EV422DRAFT_577485 [Fimicolochytrium jonesii]
MPATAVLPPLQLPNSRHVSPTPRSFYDRPVRKVNAFPSNSIADGPTMTAPAGADAAAHTSFPFRLPDLSASFKMRSALQDLHRRDPAAPMTRVVVANFCHVKLPPRGGSLEPSAKSRDASRVEKIYWERDEEAGGAEDEEVDTGRRSRKGHGRRSEGVRFAAGSKRGRGAAGVRAAARGGKVGKLMSAPVEKKREVKTPTKSSVAAVKDETTRQRTQTKTVVPPKLPSQAAKPPSGTPPTTTTPPQGPAPDTSTPRSAHLPTPGSPMARTTHSRPASTSRHSFLRRKNPSSASAANSTTTPPHHRRRHAPQAPQDQNYLIHLHTPTHTLHLASLHRLSTTFLSRGLHIPLAILHRAFVGPEEIYRLPPAPRTYHYLHLRRGRSREKEDGVELADDDDDDPGDAWRLQTQQRKPPHRRSLLVRPAPAPMWVPEQSTVSSADPGGSEGDVRGDGLAAKIDCWWTMKDVKAIRADLRRRREERRVARRAGGGVVVGRISVGRRSVFGGPGGGGGHPLGFGARTDRFGDVVGAAGPSSSRPTTQETGKRNRLWTPGTTSTPPSRPHTRDSGTLMHRLTLSSRSRHRLRRRKSRSSPNTNHDPIVPRPWSDQSDIRQSHKAALNMPGHGDPREMSSRPWSEQSSPLGRPAHSPLTAKAYFERRVRDVAAVEPFFLPGRGETDRPRSAARSVFSDTGSDVVTRPAALSSSPAPTRPLWQVIVDMDAYSP